MARVKTSARKNTQGNFANKKLAARNAPSFKRPKSTKAKFGPVNRDVEAARRRHKRRPGQVALQ
jgi:hypothetical protein